MVLLILTICNCDGKQCKQGENDAVHPAGVGYTKRDEIAFHQAATSYQVFIVLSAKLIKFVFTVGVTSALCYYYFLCRPCSKFESRLLLLFVSQTVGFKF
jgi:hypothetical protein